MNAIQSSQEAISVSRVSRLAICLPCWAIMTTALIACQPQNSQEELGEIELIPIAPDNPKSQDIAIIQTPQEQTTVNADIEQNTKTQPNNVTNTKSTQTTSSTQVTTDSPEHSSQKGVVTAQTNHANNNQIPSVNSFNSPSTNSHSTPATTNENNTVNNTKMTGEYNTQGTQITKVSYKNKAGKSIRTTFKTSAIGNLEAQVTLLDGREMTLIAPQAGGNNPIYESSDGNVVLVSHAGGGSIELIVNDEPMEFDAVTADATVLADGQQHY